MAARLVVALALVGFCASSPQYRYQRSYSVGQAYNAAGGASLAQANADPNSAQAYGSTNGGQQLYARNGYLYPGQALAQAQTYEPAAIPAYGGAKAIAQAQNGAELLVLPSQAPIAYQQNLELPQQPLEYQPGAVLAQSQALNNGASEISNSFASSNGAGIAESTANTQGLGLGQTASNAKTYGGAGFADSNAKTGYGLTSSSARTQGQGSAASIANINEPLYAAVPVAAPIEVLPAQPATIIDARSPIFHAAYVPANQAWPLASSNANVLGAGQASSSARIADSSRLTDGRTISWRFGTLYEAPGSAQAQANSNGFGSAKSAANINAYGNAQSSANTNGSGSANAITNTNSGLAYYAKGADSGAWNPAWNSAAAGRTSADAQSNGNGNAASYAGLQGLNAKVANSQANSSGFGSAQAKAQSL